MATLYWGGGTGTWDGFDATHWYTDLARTTLSARAPSAEDDVVFDASSSATGYTVTISSNTTVCKSCSITGPASGNLTLAGSGSWYIYGDISFPAAGLTRTFTGVIYLYGSATHTITTNGVSLANTVVVAGGGAYTLQDALNNGSSAIYLQSGNLYTDGKNLTCGTIGGGYSITGGTGKLYLGASVVSCSTISALPAVDAGTSNITVTGTSPSIAVGGFSFYNVTFSSAAVSTCTIAGSNTFNNLTFTTKSAWGVSIVSIGGNQTVSGALTISGQSSVNRYRVISSVIGTARTLTVGAISALTDVDFRDIAVAGASAPWSGTRLGDCGGNTSISFDATKTVYWNKPLGGNWYDSDAWATSSGGATSAANFPLAQDTVILDDTGLSASRTISNITGFAFGTLTSTKTNAYTLSGGTSPRPEIYGDLTLSSLATVSGFPPQFSGRVTQNLTSFNRSLGSVAFAGHSSEVKILDTTQFSGQVVIASGGLNTNGNTVTISNITYTQNSLPFSLTLGASTVNFPTFGLDSLNAPVMTVDAGTSTVNITGNTFGFTGQTLVWYNVNKTTAADNIVPVSVYGNNTFNNLTVPGPSADGVGALSISGDLTVNGTLTVSGSAATRRMFVRSDVAGTTRTLTAAALASLVDVDFRDISAAGTATWTGGTRIGDCGGNSGIGFTAPKTVYWNLTGTQNWSATAWATNSGGTPDVANFPLAQDICVFDDTGAATTVTINARWNIGTINASGRTSAWTFAVPSGPTIYGDVTYGSGITASATGIFTFAGRSSQTFTTAGKSLTPQLTIEKPSGTFYHGDAYTSAGNITVTSGAYSTQNYNVTCGAFSSTNSNVRTVNLGASVLTLTGSLFTLGVSANLTFSGASSTINMSSTSAKLLFGGGQEFGVVASTGGTTNTLTISGSNKFGTLTNTAQTYLILTSGTTQEVASFTYSGAAGSVVRWYTSIPGQRATLTTAAKTVGANSVDGGNNSGLVFSGAAPDYFYVKDIKLQQFVSASGGNFFLFFG